MLNSRKRATILLMLLLAAFMLAGCGRLKGSYRENGGPEVITFDGNTMTIKDGISTISGTYKINGDELVLYYTDDWFGTYEYSKKGNIITLDGYEYIKVEKGGGFGKFLLTLLILAAVGVGGYVLLKKGIPGKMSKAVDSGAVQDKIRRASQTVASSAAGFSGKAAEKAKNLTSAVSAGVTAGVAAGKAAHAQEKVKREETSPVRSSAKGESQNQTENNEASPADFCCICGAPLIDNAVSLGIAAGKKSWIDQPCYEKLKIMMQGDDVEAFEEAAGYMRSKARTADPDVSAGLRRFIRKAEERFYTDV